MSLAAQRLDDDEVINLDDEMTPEGAAELRAALDESRAQIARGELVDFDEALRELELLERA